MSQEEEKEVRGERKFYCITESCHGAGQVGKSVLHFVSLAGSCVGVGGCNLIMLIYMLLC